MILNLKNLNDHVPYIHFKRETILKMETVLNPTLLHGKINIKDAYYSIPILPEQQKIWKFSLQGNVNKLTCLPNGLSSGPRKFTKLLKPSIS